MKITDDVVNKTTKNEDVKNKKINDKKPKDKKPKEKRQMSLKEKVIIAGIVVVVLVGAIAIKSFVSPSDNVEDDKIEETKPTKKETTKDKDTSEKEDSKEDISAEAKSHLEKSNKPVKDATEAKATLKTGYDYLVSLKGADFVPTRSPELAKTSQAYARMVQTAIELGYVADIENSEWFYSQRDNVYQFVFLMKKDGAETVAFSGNYLINTKEINIASMTGSLDTDDLLSPGDGPQSKEQ